jgi:hypothetical protein
VRVTFLAYFELQFKSRCSIQNTLYAVLTCRIVLNIRVVGGRGMHPELHTNFQDHERPISAIQFLPVVNGHIQDCNSPDPGENY